MQNFEFYNPTKIIFGKNEISKLKDHIPHKRVLLLYGEGSIKQNGVYDEVMSQLKSHEVFEVSGVKPNPTYEKALEALKIIREKKIEFIIAVGGGSVIDSAKFLSLATHYQGEAWDILIKPELTFTQALPFGCVLTLPATGSEMNCFFVLSRGDQKLSNGHPLLYPKFSILDPEKTYSLSARQVGNGVVDAFVHVMEQYLTFDNMAPLQDRFAESVLKTLIEEGPKTLINPHDYDSRANLMWSATLALSSVFGVGVAHDWSTHAIGHELTALYGIDHARTLAIVFPAMMSVMKNEKKDKILQYGKRVWGISGSDQECIDQTIKKTAEFFESVGLATKLSAYDVSADVVEKVSSRLSDRGMVAMGESGKVSIGKVRAVLELAL